MPDVCGYTDCHHYKYVIKSCHDLAVATWSLGHGGSEQVQGDQVDQNDPAGLVKQAMGPWHKSYR